MLAHVADLNGFVEGIAIVLAEEGEAVIEAPYVKEMIDRCEFDTIYHEHLCYFSLTALDALFQRHGLVVADVERIPVHGGSLRVFVRRQGAAVAQRVIDLRAEEAGWGVSEAGPYEAFAARVAQLERGAARSARTAQERGEQHRCIRRSGKGSTLLNVFGIGAETLDFVVDRSTVKVGRYMPGVHLRIDPPERLLEEMPDYLLLLAWNLADEIMAQQDEYRRRGGRFVVPGPGAGGGVT